MTDTIDLESCCCRELKEKNISLSNKSPSVCRLGIHISPERSLIETVTTNDHKTMQIFLGSPISYNVRSVTEIDRTKTIEYCKKNNKTIYFHAPYIAYLARPAGTMKETEQLQKSIDVVQKSLDNVKGIPGGCVLHMGKVGTIQLLIQRLNNLVIDCESSPEYKPLLMEVGAGQKNEIGSTWNEIRLLYEGLDHSRIGLCLDTQHMFSAGMNKFHNHEDIVKVFDNVNDICGFYPSLIHLNDSKCGFHGCKDRHENIGCGHIWSSRKDDPLDGLTEIIQRSKEHKIDLILETPNPINDYNKLKNLFPEM